PPELHRAEVQEALDRRWLWTWGHSQPMSHDSHIRDVKHLLTDPVRLVSGLGWGEGARRQSRGLLIRCPKHGERNPSCSVRVAQDGMVSVKCFACQWSGD